jgi:hypothetical protein
MTKPPSNIAPINSRFGGIKKEMVNIRRSQNLIFHLLPRQKRSSKLFLAGYNHRSDSQFGFFHSPVTNQNVLKHTLYSLFSVDTHQRNQVNSRLVAAVTGSAKTKNASPQELILDRLSDDEL